MNWELFGICIYVLVMLGMGVIVSRRIQTEDDYFLAGRSLGPYLATFSIFATWFGAETCVGTSGKVFREGPLGAHADPFGYSLCIILMALFFARILWQKKITTLPDLFRTRYSISAERLAALIMIPSSLVWAGAQIRAFGQIISTTTDFSVATSVTVAASVVILYTISGGLLADAYTDLIQGIALIVGLIILVVAITMDLGGTSQLLNSIAPSSLNLSFQGELADASLMGRLELLLVPILGSLMSQELVSRVVASRSEKVAIHSTWRAASLYLAVGMLPVIIGLVGHHYYPNLEESDSIMPLLARKHLPYFAYVIFVGALVSAILSTVDSTLLAVSALFSHNLYLPQYPNTSEKGKVIVARLGVFTSGLIAYGIAFTSDSVTGLVETASALGGPTILVMVSFALFTKLGNGTSAVVAMLASIATWFVCHFWTESESPVIWTVVVSLASYLATLPFVSNNDSDGDGLTEERAV